MLSSPNVIFVGWIQHETLSAETFAEFYPDRQTQSVTEAVGNEVNVAGISIVISSFLGIQEHLRWLMKQMKNAKHNKRNEGRLHGSHAW
jgi:hypothetical protein